MGYSKVPLDLECDQGEENVCTKDLLDDKFVWTYSSPEFPMAQVSLLKWSSALLNGTSYFTKRY